MKDLPFIAVNSGTGGGGGGGDTIITGHVATYANLPAASGYTGQYYIVDTNTGTWLLGTLKKAGLYKSNGTTWVYIDNVPETTSLSDGTTTITGTNIILQGSGSITTQTDALNNKIVISAPSVPTKTSDITNDSGFIVTETDPVFSASQAHNITSTHIMVLNNTSGTNTGDQDLSGKLDKNTAITGATKTKITYDADGLVTSGEDATTADITDSTNKRYVTDANLVVINNTSNTNTGDETASGIKDKLETLTTTSRLNATAIQHLTPKNNILKDQSTFIYTYISADQSLSAGVVTKINLNTKTDDNLGEFNVSTGRFTPSFTQRVDFYIKMVLSNLSGECWLMFYKNGSPDQAISFKGSGNINPFPVNFIAGNYYEFYIQSPTTNTLSAYSSIGILTKGKDS